jgi:hypothetical protein
MRYVTVGDIISEINCAAMKKEAAYSYKILVPKIFKSDYIASHLPALVINIIVTM